MEGGMRRVERSGLCMPRAVIPAEAGIHNL
jgi:hypothetical protein